MRKEILSTMIFEERSTKRQHLTFEFDTRNKLDEDCLFD